jgi:hypothetical protein
VSCENILVRGTLNANIAASGSQLARQLFTANGTYTPTPGTRTAILRGVAGGGGGGSVNAATGPAGAGGGCSGEYIEVLISPGALVTGGAVVVGTGGAGGTGASAGGGGVDSTIVIQGVTYTARGGVGGTGCVAANTPGGGGPAQAGGVANVTYRECQAGNGGTSTTLAGLGGNGGSSPWGSGGAQQTASTGAASAVGISGFFFGGGGCGAQTGPTFAGGAPAGGAGRPGAWIIDEYA